MFLRILCLLPIKARKSDGRQIQNHQAEKIILEFDAVFYQEIRRIYIQNTDLKRNPPARPFGIAHNLYNEIYITKSTRAGAFCVVKLYFGK